MTFKKNWKKTDQDVHIEATAIKAIVDRAFPRESLLSHQLISEGCANLNIKFYLENHTRPFILRVYLRDKDAAYREQKLAELLKGHIPIPEVYFIDDFNQYRFAITQYKHGTTLRNVLLNGHHDDIPAIMAEVGSTLAKIQSYQFPCSCFFAHDLSIQRKLTQDDYLTFTNDCLTHPTVVSQLSAESLTQIRNSLEWYGHFLPDESAHNLVHGDYDPANILVDNTHGRWNVSAVLDWEFAFSGPMLCDVANMLRYAHHMPPSYETAFLKSLQENGVQLHKNWRISVHMLNISSLLDCLIRCSPSTQPNRCRDIRELIDYILTNLASNEVCKPHTN